MKREVLCKENLLLDLSSCKTSLWGKFVKINVTFVINMYCYIICQDNIVFIIWDNVSVIDGTIFKKCCLSTSLSFNNSFLVCFQRNFTLYKSFSHWIVKLKYLTNLDMIFCYGVKTPKFLSCQKDTIWSERVVLLSRTLKKIAQKADMILRNTTQTKFQLWKDFYPNVEFRC